MRAPKEKKHSMTTHETNKISTIEAKLNRLKAKRAALTHQHKTTTKRERMQRTRTLIQLGGLLSKVKLIDTFDINLGDDLQGDLECHDKAMTLLGLFVSVMDQLPETIDKSALKHKGICFMKTQK